MGDSRGEGELREAKLWSAIVGTEVDAQACLVAKDRTAFQEAVFEYMYTQTHTNSTVCMDNVIQCNVDYPDIHLSGTALKNARDTVGYAHMHLCAR